MPFGVSQPRGPEFFHMKNQPINEPWIVPPQGADLPGLYIFRKKFEVASGCRLRVFVSADTVYELFLDGRFVLRGPELGDPGAWFFDSFRASIAPGSHLLVARVWFYGANAPVSRFSLEAGFVLSVCGDRHPELGTGAGGWEVVRVEGTEFGKLGGRKMAYYALGSDLRLRMTKTAQLQYFGGGPGWQEAAFSGLTAQRYAPTGEPRPFRVPVAGNELKKISRLISGDYLRLFSAVEERPRGTVELSGIGKLWAGESHVVPSRRKQRWIFQLSNYFCAYVSVATRRGRGASVGLRWSETPPVSATAPLLGPVDVFCPPGGEFSRFTFPFWKAGMFFSLEIETADEPLEIFLPELEEVSYALAEKNRFVCDDSRWTGLLDISLRTLRMCCHDTFMDCPHYEQLQYIGDTRTQLLSFYAVEGDVGLPEKVLAMLARGRLDSGFLSCRYPSAISQSIPPFSLWFVGLVHDFAMWRGNAELVESLLPVLRSVAETVVSLRGAKTGLLAVPEGWMFYDWVPDWPMGVPPGGREKSPFAAWNLHAVCAFRQLADLEEWTGCHLAAERFRRFAGQLLRETKKAFWRKAQGLYSDTFAGDVFSRHTQILAMLAGERRPGGWKGEKVPGEPAAPSPYFGHYQFEVLRSQTFQRLWHNLWEPWLRLPGEGNLTTPEMWENRRSLCHAWSAHAVFHASASVLGVRPGSPAFSSVEIRPLPGKLKVCKTSVPHPKGEISVELKKETSQWKVVIELPGKVSGNFVWGNNVVPLSGGKRVLRVPGL